MDKLLEEKKERKKKINDLEKKIKANPNSAKI